MKIASFESITDEKNQEEENESLLVQKDDVIELKVSNLKSPFLSLIGDYEEEFYDMLKKEANSKDIDKMILAFWLSLYTEKYKLAKSIINKSPKIQEIFNANFINEKEFLSYLVNLKLFGKKYNSIVFEAAVKNDEEYLAMVITQFDFMLTKDILVVILEKEMLNLLKMILLKGHVFVYSQVTDKDNNVLTSEIKLTKLTFNYLFSKIGELKSKEKERIIIQKILKWQIPTRENYLSALLHNDMDELAIENLDSLKNNVDVNTIIRAIKGNNEYFLRTLINLGYINNSQFYDEDIFKELLLLSSKGDSIVFALNIISILKLSKLNLEFCIELVGNLKDVFLGFKENKEILKCHNPIFAICLSAEILDKISSRK